MIRMFACVFVLVALTAVGWATPEQTPSSFSVPSAADTVHVAPPTGEMEADRASILAALAEVEPGGTVQFALGTYLIGEAITVAVPEVTLLGHPDGTTLRGCDPSAFGDKDFAVAECNGFNLTGGHQAVRDLTFEYTWHALILGGQPCKAGDCPPGILPVDARSGGYVVEHNEFRESQNGIRVVGQWQEPAVIRDNQFINTYHAVMVNGMTAHVVDNQIAVPEAERVPNTRHPGLALMIGGWEAQGAPACDRNVIAGNRISGHPDAIAILLFPGGTCRDNVIRDNTIEMSPVPFASPSTAIHVRSTADSTVAGVPLALLNGVFGDGVIEGSLIEGNRIIGAEGLAIEVLGAKGSRIVDNTIIGVTSRDPFPGNTLFPETPEWREANGSGIWISPGSDENAIRGNTFEEVAGAAVVLEGNGNRVEVPSPGDMVRDLGSRNRLVGGVDESSGEVDAVRLAQEDTILGVGFRSLDIDGHAVRIYSRGIESRAAGSPVVVLEGPIEAWTGVLEALGDTVAFLAYDPPGVGQSEWNDARPTPERMSEWARGVLDMAGAEPPYVLVGHSWSGWNVRAFEGRYPSDVAGLVLVDPTSPSSAFQASFDEVEAGPHGTAEFWRLVERMLAGAPLAVRARQQVIHEYQRSGMDPDVPAVPSVPFVVLSAGRFDSTELPGSEELPFDVPAFFRSLRRQGTTAHAALVNRSANGTHVLADSSPHCIHCATPELVARAIERVLAPGGVRE